MMQMTAGGIVATRAQSYAAAGYDTSSHLTRYDAKATPKLQSISGVAYGIGAIKKSSTVLQGATDDLGALYGYLSVQTGFDLGNGPVAGGTYLKKTDPNAVLVWIQPASAVQLTTTPSMRADSSGSLALTAHTGSACGSGPNGFVAKLDAQGNCSWTKTFTGALDAVAHDIAVNDDIIVAASFSGSATLGGGALNAGSAASFAASKFSAAGTLAWSEVVTNSSNAGVTISHLNVSVRPNGNVILSAVFDGTLQLGQATFVSSAQKGDGIIIELGAADGKLQQVVHGKNAGDGFFATARASDVIAAASSWNVDLGCGALAAQAGTFPVILVNM